jgi:hypothetical protein
MSNRREGVCLREANVKARKVTMMLAAAGLAISPVASNAASSLSIVRAAPQMSGASFLQDEDHHRGPGAMVILGVLLVVLMGAAAIAGNGNSPNNPHSP